MEWTAATRKLILILLYIIAVVITFFLFRSNNIVLIKAVVVALLFVFLALLTINFRLSPISVLPSESSEMLRYTMLCRSCGWEWMSQVTKKALAPTKCPNCSNDKLEILGWRRVKVLNKQNKDLREFVK